MKKKVTDYYKQIDDALRRIESGQYQTHTIDWICGRIDWCWKFRKISEDQMGELSDRAVKVLGNGNAFKVF